MNLSKILRLCLIACSASLISGCAAFTFKSEFKPPIGGLFTEIKAPLTINFDNTPVSEHYGESTALYFMEPFFGTSYAWEECSLESAAANGSIKSVDYADYEFFCILGLFARTTVRAYGDKTAK